MKVLYIDESGVPELSANDKFVILCGVLINEEDEKNLLFLVEHIKGKYKIDLSRHLHATEIFENISKKCYLGKTIRRPMRDLRKDFQKEIWEIIKDYGIEYYAVTVPKEFVKKSLGLHKRPDYGEQWIKRSDNFYAKIDRQLPMDVGVNAIYHWAMRKNEEDKIKIIFESRVGDLFTIKNYNHVKDTNVFKNPHMVSFATKFKQSCVLAGFANKEVKYVGLELADIISYTCNIYFLQIKKRTKVVENELKKSILFKGIDKTLNKKHYRELNQATVRKYIPGLDPRTQRIAKHYRSLQLRLPLSPANAGSQVS